MGTLAPGAQPCAPSGTPRVPTTCSMCMNSHAPILLQTAKATVFDVTQQGCTSLLKVRATLDAGSQGSYVMTWVKETFSARKSHSETVIIKTFGSKHCTKNQGEWVRIPGWQSETTKRFLGGSGSGTSCMTSSWCDWDVKEDQLIFDVSEIAQLMKDTPNQEMCYWPCHKILRPTGCDLTNYHPVQGTIPTAVWEATGLGWAFGRRALNRVGFTGFWPSAIHSTQDT